MVRSLDPGLNLYVRYGLPEYRQLAGFVSDMKQQQKLYNLQSEDATSCISHLFSSLFKELKTQKGLVWSVFCVPTFRFWITLGKSLPVLSNCSQGLRY